MARAARHREVRRAVRAATRKIALEPREVRDAQRCEQIAFAAVPGYPNSPDGKTHEIEFIFRDSASGGWTSQAARGGSGWYASA
jgi:hypothetical protein